MESLGRGIEGGAGMYTGGTRSGETGLRGVPSSKITADYADAHKRFDEYLEAA